jgi:hypothetical protein
VRSAAGEPGVGVVVGRLRARRGEIVQAIFARVREVVPDTVGSVDVEYLAGLRGAVAAAVDYGLEGIERGGEGWSATIPAQAVAQAQRAARSGVSVSAVLRRYIVGHALFWDYVMQEADRVELAGEGSGLREMSRVQTSLLDRLVAGVTREHEAELERAGRSREQRLSERVRALLVGEGVDGGGGERGAVSGLLGLEADYDLDGEHLGVIGRGAGVREALGDVARRLDRRLLCVNHGEGTVWAWLGGRHGLRMLDLERALSSSSSSSSSAGVLFVVGEPAWGLEGWRLTHRQAQAALAVALRRPRRLTRYADVALLAAALEDEALAGALVEIYLAPLEDARGGGVVLRETLRAYFAAERNASSAAAALGVVRRTVENRLHTIEERLGRSLHPCPAELEIALRLDELGVSTATGRNLRKLDRVRVSTLS